MRTSVVLVAWAVGVMGLVGCGSATQPMVGPSGPPDSTSTGPVAVDCQALEPVVEVEGALSDDPEIAQAQRKRAESGLPSDIGTVERLMSQTDPPYVMSFPHTEDELGELLSRNKRSRQGGAIHRWAGREAADSFAGVWMDQAAGGVFTVAFAKDVDRYRKVVHERFDPAIRVVHAAHTHRDLMNLQDEMQTALMQQHTSGGTWTPPDRSGDVVLLAKDNQLSRVRVGVLEPDDELRRELAATWGAEWICLEPVDIPDADDAQPAAWEPAPDADLSTDSTSIDILVKQVGCASGRSAEGRIPPPEVDYRPDAIVVTIKVVPLPGLQQCPSNPDTPYTLHLDEPLGDRQLLDGNTQPPSPPPLDLP